MLLPFGSATPDGSSAVVTFVGEHDRQIRPEDFVLYLSRVRYGGNGVERAWDVSGECKVNLVTNLMRCDGCRSSALCGGLPRQRQAGQRQSRHYAYSAITPQSPKPT